MYTFSNDLQQHIERQPVSRRIAERVVTIGQYFPAARPNNRGYIEVSFGGFIPPTVQVGAILTNESPLMIRAFGLETAPCSGNWKLVQGLDHFALDRKIHAAGWNFFYMAGEVKGMFLGALKPKRIQSALHRMLGKVKQQHFNGLEVTGIVAKRFLGIPYAVLTAHSRHVQRSCSLDSAETRLVSQLGAEWASG